MATNPVRKHFSITLKDFYRKYRADQRAEGKPCSEILSEKRYKKLMESFFTAIMHKIIYENHTFLMPHSLGSITVKTYKNDNLRKCKVDFNQTKKLGKVVRHLNRHTYGDAFGIGWDKSYVQFRNNTFYCFKTTSSRYATESGVGAKALSKHIYDLSKDPTKRSYIRI